MAGETNTTGQWRIPPKVQQIISGVSSALLVAGILGIFGLWSEVNSISSDFRHMRERQALVHGELIKDIAVFTQWKETFGAKKRFGQEDGDKIERRLIQLEIKVAAEHQMRVLHDTNAAKYIERIDQQGKRISSMWKSQHHTEEMMNEHLQREKHRGTP